MLLDTLQGAAGEPTLICLDVCCTHSCIHDHDMHLRHLTSQTFARTCRSLACTESALCLWGAQMMCSVLAASSAWPVLLNHRYLLTLAADMVHFLHDKDLLPSLSAAACLSAVRVLLGIRLLLLGTPIATPAQKCNTMRQRVPWAARVPSSFFRTCPLTLLLRVRRLVALRPLHVRAGHGVRRCGGL